MCTLSLKNNYPLYFQKVLELTTVSSKIETNTLAHLIA